MSHPNVSVPAHANPFGSRHIDALPFLPQGCTWEDIWARLEAARYRGAIVGPEGSGKTTLLEHLDRGLVLRGWRVHRLRGSLARPRLTGALPRDLSKEDIVIIDSGEAVPWLDWYRLRWRARHAGGLLVTVHRPGRLPTLIENSTSETLLLSLLRQLVSPVGPELEQRALALFARHRGNMRETFRSLYDMTAGIAH